MVICLQKVPIGGINYVKRYDRLVGMKMQSTNYSVPTMWIAKVDVITVLSR
jgi:hypothetical protein